MQNDISRLTNNKAGVRAINITGLAVMAFLLHNQYLPSISVNLGSSENPGQYPAMLVYFFFMLVAAIVLATIKPETIQAILRNRSIVFTSGIAGAVGIFFTSLPSYDSFMMVLLLSIAIALSSVFVIFYMVFWTSRIVHISETPLLDALIAIALAYALTVVTSLIDIETVWLVITMTIVVAILSFLSFKLPTSARLIEEQLIKDWNNLFGIAALIFVLVGVVLIDSYSANVAKDVQPNRSVMYGADLVVCAAAIAFVWLSGKNRPISSLMAVFGLYAMSLVAAILIAVLFLSSDVEYGKHALIAGRNLFEGFVLLLTAACPKRTVAESARYAAGAIAAGIALPHTISYAVRFFGGNDLYARADFAQLLLVTILGAFVVGALATGIFIFATNKALHAAANATQEAQSARDALEDAAQEAQSARDALEDAKQTASMLEKSFGDKSETAAQLAVGAWSLSHREAEVAKLAYKNYSAKRIADELFIGSGTANTHIKSIYRKAQVHSRNELISAMDALVEGKKL